jgi:hypothetical protein
MSRLSEMWLDMSNKQQGKATFRQAAKGVDGDP